MTYQSSGHEVKLPSGDEVKPRFWSIKDTGKLTGLGRSTIYNRIADGTLKSAKVGARRLILDESISALANPGAA